ncbi:MAG: ferrochelatase [Candidatus Saccharimonadales bacterium]
MIVAKVTDYRVWLETKNLDSPHRGFLFYTNIHACFSKKGDVILTQVDISVTPTKRAPYPYLKQLLSDERIIDSPCYYWLPILYGIILQVRPRKMTISFADICTKKGLPLLVHSEAQVLCAQKHLGEKFVAKLGFIYAEPTMSTAIHELHDTAIHRIIVIPLFSQFSTTASGSVYDENSFFHLSPQKHRSKPIEKCPPALRFVDPFYNDSEYMKVLTKNIKNQMKKLPNKPDKVFISFHGILESYVDEGGPYPQQFRETTSLLTQQSIGWKKNQYKVTYRRRFGRAEWLQLYTQVELPTLHEQDIKYPLIVASGFTTDCLVTIHELGIEARELYIEDGDLMRIDCLNDNPSWPDYLTKKVKTHAGGW